MKRVRTRVARPQSVGFDGYHRRDVPAPDPELTQVGPGTPCGEYLRRFWQPAAFARDLDGTVRCACAFSARTWWSSAIAAGAIGVLHLHCAHRGTSLEFGIPLERGIRCCYHGWVYDVDGRCLATPGEPAGSRARASGSWQGAYPTHEFSRAGVRLSGTAGSTARVPAVRQLRRAGLPADAGGAVRAAVQLAPGEGQQHGPGAHRVSARAEQRLPVHRGVRRRARARLDARPTPGMVYIATRRVGDLVWVRVCDFMPPNVHQFTREIEEATRCQAGQPARDHPLGGAQRRHAHDELRAGARWTRRGGSRRSRWRGRASDSPTIAPTPSGSATPRTSTPSRASGAIAVHALEHLGLDRIAASSCSGVSCATGSARWRAAQDPFGTRRPDGKVDPDVHAGPSCCASRRRRAPRPTGGSCGCHRPLRAERQKLEACRGAPRLRRGVFSAGGLGAFEAPMKQSRASSIFRPRRTGRSARNA